MTERETPSDLAVIDDAISCVTKEMERQDLDAEVRHALQKELALLKEMRREISARDCT